MPRTKIYVTNLFFGINNEIIRVITKQLYTVVMRYRAIHEHASWRNFFRLHGTSAKIAIRWLMKKRKLTGEKIGAIRGAFLFG